MNAPLTVGSLFAGVGGFDLGLERAGMRTVWFCEQDEFCQRVLARHWPGVPVYDDVCALVADAGRIGVERRGAGREVAGAAGAREGEGPQRQRVWDAAGNRGATGTLPVPVPYVDVLCGGFPCQDLSYAGAGAGLDGARSGLWSEYARLIGELRPRYVVVENVAALLARGLGTVLADLAALGYDAEWDCIPASAVGAPHRRDRIWLVAYPSGDDGGQGWSRGSAPSGAREPQSERAFQVADELTGICAGPGLGALADTGGVGCERRPRLCGDWRDQAERRGTLSNARDDGREAWGDWWSVEPDVGRVAHGVPARVDRLRSLGNSLVPQIAEWIGARILAYEAGRLDVPSSPRERQ